MGSNEAVISKPKKDAFSKRIHEVDLLRGFLIILVIIDHILWNMKYYGEIWMGQEGWMYQAFNFYWTSVARGIIQPIALMLFCFVSGVSCAFSKSNKKRAIVTLIFWAIIALGSNVIQLILTGNGVEGLEIRVDFNIIGVLAFSTLLYCLFEKKSWRSLLVVIIFSFLISNFLSPMLRESLLKLCGGHVCNRPGVAYGVGNTTPNFYMPLFWEYPHQADFVPLFPYIIAFFLGALFSYFFYKEKRQSLFPKRKEWERPICFLGRHTLVIYLAHYFVIRAIFIIINLIITGRFA